MKQYFFIRKNATEPLLRMRVYVDWRNSFRQFSDRIENSAITFAMQDYDTGVYKVANKEAGIVKKPRLMKDVDDDYYIFYRFNSNETNKPGIYKGQFKIIFFDTNNNNAKDGELIIPIQNELYIHVLDSFVVSEEKS